MSFQAMAAAIPLRLPTNDKFVLLMLANYADENGKCWPSIDRLSQDTGLSESSVRRSLHSLRDYSGIIAVQKRIDSDGRQTSNNFLIDLALCRRLAEKGGGEGVTLTPPPVTVEGGRVSHRQGEGVTLTPEPIIEPIIKNQHPVRSTPTALPRLQESPFFLRFWETYPATKRRVAKKSCFDVWKRNHLDDLAEQIVAHVSAMSRTENWMTGYEPAPLTYLHQRRWEDGVPAKQQKPMRVAL